MENNFTVGLTDLRSLNDISCSFSKRTSLSFTNKNNLDNFYRANHLLPHLGNKPILLYINPELSIEVKLGLLKCNSETISVVDFENLSENLSISIFFGDTDNNTKQVAAYPISKAELKSFLVNLYITASLSKKYIKVILNES